MPTVILEIDIDEALAQEYFEYAGYHVRDMRDPFRRVADEVILEAVEGQFNEKGARSGSPWPPLSDEYWEWKELNYPGMPMLRLTDRMYNAMLNDPRAFHITRDSLRYAPRDPKVEFHQSGQSRERGGTLPPRRTVELIAEDYEQIQFIFQDWLDELRAANIRRGAPGEAVLPAPNVYIFGL